MQKSQCARVCGTLILYLAGGATAGFGGPYYLQTNLTSDVPGMALNTDPNLKNPWGMSFGATTPFWVSDQGTNVSTLYNGSGVPQSLVVHMPAATPPQGPTGQVFNGTTAFDMAPGAPARFLFSTLSGQIEAWNPAVATANALTEFAATDNAVYTGLALGSNGAGSFLYSADFANGKIDVIDSAFHKTTLAGGFTDPNLPAGYTPYNIQNIGGKLYVTYAQVDPITHRASEDDNQGIVDVFDVNGNFLQRLATAAHLSSPWGLTIAPAGFGVFANALLVGNFGSGTISAFNPTSGAFLGNLMDGAGNTITNDGLWALAFRAPGSGFNPNALFFTAGINDEQNGLFGEITFVPEPGTVTLTALGVLAFFAGRRRLSCGRRASRARG